MARNKVVYKAIFCQMNKIPQKNQKYKKKHDVSQGKLIVER